jgi:sortase A
VREVDTGDKTENGGAIGRIEIARLGVSSIILEGSDETTLRRGIGHISGTALPGQPGNVGLAGHRDTFFRALRNVRRDDAIVLRTPRGDYRYHVVWTRTVSPSAIEVLHPTPEASVTLVTCYPFYFVGAAPERFIVRAVKDKASLRGPDGPAPVDPH